MVEGEETKLEPYLKNQSISVADALQKELDMRSLPPIELMSFNGDSAVWPDFIENFKTRVHQKGSFNDQIRIERLFSVLTGEALKSVEGIGKSGIFYTSVLKSQLRD